MLRQYLEQALVVGERVHASHDDRGLRGEVVEERFLGYLGPRADVLHRHAVVAALDDQLQRRALHRKPRLELLAVPQPLRRCVLPTVLHDARNLPLTMMCRFHAGYHKFRPRRFSSTE